MDTLLTYRRSAIEAASCLKRFQAIYELGLEDESDESRRGTAFHYVVLEEYLPSLVRTGKRADRDLLDQAFRRGIPATRCPAHLVDEVEDLVFRWGSRFELDLDAFLESEAQQVTGRVRWRPDLIYAWRLTPRGSVLRVEDLKTYHAILSEDTIRAELQGQLYIRNAIATWPGFDVYEFAMTFVRFGVTRVVEFTADELEGIDRKVDSVIATIDAARAANDWPAQPGNVCGFCRLQCEVADDPRVLDRRCLTDEEARIVAGRLSVIGRMYDTDLKSLKAWCTTEGPVRLNGLEWAHRTTARVRYDARQTLEVITSRRAPDPPGLSFSKSSLAKLHTKAAARAWPGLQEEIAQLALTKQGTRFGAKKVGDDAPDAGADDEEDTA